ncbi:hypothetical protein AB0N09_05465 [Streptomyces erythrochromogenes]|uniref:hypothetical protein n=1 Tax=Streptomyces erythrochromogenes TaxID=285574 RepID=UPI003434A9CD
MRRHEGLLLAYDTGTDTIVRITDQGPDYWTARAYSGTRQIICLLCAYGYDIPTHQSVPLVHKGKIGGQVRRHWAHPPSTGPEGGHSPESVWHMHAKLFAAQWARTLPNVADARLEIPTADRSRRSDVLVTLTSGARLALEPHCYERTDREWELWLADHRAAGITPVLLLHPDLAPAHVLWAEGHCQVWQLHLTIAEAGDSAELAAFMGGGHERTGPWWEGSLTPYAPHWPPCPGDTVTVTDGFPFSGLVVDENGICCGDLEGLIEQGRALIGVEAAAVRRRVEAELRKERQLLKRLERRIRALLAVEVMSRAQYQQTVALVWEWLDAHGLPVRKEPPRWAGDMAPLCERASGHVGRLDPFSRPVADQVCRHTARGGRALAADAPDRQARRAATAELQAALAVIARHQGLEQLGPAQPPAPTPAPVHEPALPAAAPGSVCGCADPQLTARIEEREYLVMPSSQFGPVSALYRAWCRSCGGSYNQPWRRILGS